MNQHRVTGDGLLRAEAPEPVRQNNAIQCSLFISQFSFHSLSTSQFFVLADLAISQYFTVNKTFYFSNIFIIFVKKNV